MPHFYKMGNCVRHKQIIGFFFFFFTVIEAPWNINKQIEPGRFMSER